MILDPKLLDELAIQFEPRNYLRLMASKHAANPLGMGFGATRFASPRRSFQLVYLASNLATAIAETIVRDRFEGSAARMLDISEVEDWAAAEISAVSPLTVIDLRTTGLLRLGVSTDAARAKAQDEGRRLSQAIHDGFAVDGLMYFSRLTGAECLAVYGRAVASKLTAGPAIPALHLSNFVPSLQQLRVTLIRI